MISFVKAFRDWLKTNGQLAGLTVQLYQWEDLADKNQTYFVIQPNGGSTQVAEMGAEHTLQISLVAGKASGFTIEEKARALIAFVLNNPIAPFGYVESVGGLPAPIFTADNRMVLRLTFRIIATA